MSTVLAGTLECYCFKLRVVRTQKLRKKSTQPQNANDYKFKTVLKSAWKIKLVKDFICMHTSTV